MGRSFTREGDCGGVASCARAGKLYWDCQVLKAAHIFGGRRRGRPSLWRGGVILGRVWSNNLLGCGIIKKSQILEIDSRGSVAESWFFISRRRGPRCFFQRFSSPRETSHS